MFPPYIQFTHHLLLEISCGDNDAKKLQKITFNNCYVCNSPVINLRCYLSTKLPTTQHLFSFKKLMHDVTCYGVQFQYLTAQNSSCQLSSLERNNILSLDPTYHSAVFLNSHSAMNSCIHTHTHTKHPHTHTPTIRHNERQTTLQSCDVIRLVNWKTAFRHLRQLRAGLWSSLTEIVLLIVLVFQASIAKEECDNTVSSCSQVKSQTAIHAGVKGHCGQFAGFIVMELPI